MNTHVVVNDMPIPLDDFTEIYIGNVLNGIATSLGYSSKNITLLIMKEKVTMLSDRERITIDELSEHYLITSTIKGMLSTFENIPWFEDIYISTHA